MDYALFCKKDVEYNLNPEEVKEVRYVGRNEIQEFVNSRKQAGVAQEKISPWLQLFIDHELPTLWEVIEKQGTKGLLKVNSIENYL